MRSVTVRSTGVGKFQQSVHVGPHEWLADEPKDVAGDDTGPAPFDHVLAGLGACTSMTIKMYADRKALPLRAVEVVLTLEKQPDGNRITRNIKLDGDLSDEQRQRLIEIANKCPVHKLLTGKIEVATSETR